MVVSFRQEGTGCVCLHNRQTGISMDVEMGVVFTSDIDEKLDRIGGEAQ